MSKRTDFYVSPTVRLLRTETETIVCASDRTYTNEVETSGQNIVEIDNDEWESAWK